jgi:hypothetical protein
VDIFSFSTNFQNFGDLANFSDERSGHLYLLVMSDSKQVRLAAVSSAKGVMPSLQHVSMLVLQLACDIRDIKRYFKGKGYLCIRFDFQKERQCHIE